MRPLLAAGVRTLTAAALVVSFGPACHADEWVERNAPLGLDEFTFLVAGGVNYGAVFGSELEHVDPSVGFWANGAFRVHEALSACVSVSHNLGQIDGQLTQILDHEVRPDGRSGHAVGEVELLRFGAGVRVDAFREMAWRWRPYAQAEVLRTQFDVTLDSVNGAPPPPGTSSFDDSQWGALGRAGVDYRLGDLVGLDLAGTFEFLEFPAGTSSIVSIQGGASLRF
jgi:hypothetical protein